MMRKKLNQLPEPTLLKSDYETTLSRLRANYQTATGHYPGTNDPETFQLEQLAYEREILVDEINREGKQNLLAHANDANLDNLGALVDCERLQATAAHSIFEFLFQDGHGGFTLVKGWSVITKNGKAAFSLNADVHVVRDTDTAKLVLYCTHTGEDGNGFFAGDIAQIAQPNKNIISVSNVNLSLGGSDKEQDDQYRNRIHLAPSAFSCAGPFEAYEYFAHSAHQDIVNVAVLSPEPNHINIYILLKDQQVPTSELLKLVESACNDKKRRPIGDVVTAFAAEARIVNASIHLKIYSDMQTMAQVTVEKAKQEVERIALNWQRKLGKDIVPQDLTAPLQMLNVVYLASTDLLFTELAKHQYPAVTIENVTYEIVNETTE